MNSFFAKNFAARTNGDELRAVWTVSRLNAEVRAVLDGSFPAVWVQGEISNLAQPASGHIYLTLKDEASQVRCAMFRGKRRLLEFKPQNGQQVLARARIGLYEPRGEFQLILEHMEPAGTGALLLQMERLRRKLADEGLFDPRNKRELPRLPERIGLITSPSGAAVHDLLTVLNRRLPMVPIIIYPAQVQGAEAPASLLRALQLANARRDCAVLILARGGGSLEDLMAFNNEALVRALCASAIPVITGIGHEVDSSLADLAADQRAATPSAAAELAVPSADDLARRLRGLEARAARRVAALTLERQGALRRLQAHLRLLHPARRLQQQAQKLDLLTADLSAAMRHGVIADRRARLQVLALRLRALSPESRSKMARYRLDGCARRMVDAMHAASAARRSGLGLLVEGLSARSPLATLARGYSIVRRASDGTLVRSVGTVAKDDVLNVRLSDGSLQCVAQGVKIISQP